MLVRITVTQGSPKKETDVIRYIEKHIIPAAQKEPGFQGGYWLADRATGKGMALIFWENEEAEQASQEMAAQTRARAVEVLGGEVQGIEVYEVVAHAAPRPTRRVTARGSRPARASATARVSHRTRQPGTIRQRKIRQERRLDSAPAG